MAGINTWSAVSTALVEIRNKQLWRKDYKSWADYLERRWKKTRQWAHLLTEGHAAVQGLTPQNVKLFDKSTAATALAKVPKEKRDQVVAKVTASGKPVTAKAITEAAKESKPDVELDATGWPIPASIIPLWNRAGEVQGVLSAMSKVKGALAQAQEQDDPLWRQLSFSTVIGDLSKAWTSIQSVKPYAVCTQCQGHPDTQPKGQCRLCCGTGLISQFKYDRLVPEEIKKVREKGRKK